MKFTSILALATGAIAATIPLEERFLGIVPGYPLGNGFCLTDQQAQFVANTYRTMLTDTNKQQVNATAQAFIANSYQESSQSINTLSGQPVGATTFATKQVFINGIVGAPALPSMSTIDIVHDCTRVVWQWQINGLGENIAPVAGFNKITVNVFSGQALSNNLEFNSIAWGEDVGWTCTPPS